MLSVFITPWAKPTACHCAIRRAVRRVTSREEARHSADPVAGELRDSDASMTWSASSRSWSGWPREAKYSKVPKRTWLGRQAHQHGGGLHGLALHRRVAADDAQRARGGDAQPVHRLAAEVLADGRAQHRAAVAACASSGVWPPPLRCRSHARRRRCAPRPAGTRGRRPAAARRRRTGGRRRPARPARSPGMRLAAGRDTRETRDPRGRGGIEIDERGGVGIERAPGTGSGSGVGSTTS